MSRKSQVTESVSYRVEQCHVCESEVGLGEDIPERELVRQEFAVLIGEGAVSISEESAGNWDAEVEFSGEQSDANPPTVTGHILCAECAEAIHNHPPNSEVYRGPLPDKLDNKTSSPEIPISDRALVALVVVLVLFVIFLLL